MSTSSSTSGLALSGLTTGLDTSTLVSQLMSIQSRPVQQMQTQQAKAQSQLDAYRTINTKLMALQTSAKSLVGVSQNLSPFSAKTATSSNSTAFSAAINGNASPGTYNIAVTNLATAQTYGGGTFNAGHAAGTFDINGPNGTATITVNSGDSAQDVADQINLNVNSSMYATVAGGRLLLTAKDTGAANNSTFSDSSGGTLLTSLGLDSSTNSAGVDANITVNGIAESSANNVFTGALSGVDLTASAVGTGTVTIASDPSQVVNGVKDLVAKFNDIVSTINGDIAYNADTKTGGPLTGDSYASNLLSSLTRQITGMFDTSAQASGSLTGLRSYSDVGISVQKDGTLSLDATKLTAALQNYPTQTSSSASAYQLFAWEDNKTNPDTSKAASMGAAGNSTVAAGNSMAAWQAGWGDGIANRISGFIDGLISPNSLYNTPNSTGGRYDGGVLSHINSLNTQISNYSKEIDAYNLRLDTYKTFLTNQFNNMESVVAKLRNQGSYLSSQFAGGSSGSSS